MHEESRRDSLGMLAVEERRLRGTKLGVLPRLDKVGTTYHLSNCSARLQPHIKYIS